MVPSELPRSIQTVFALAERNPRRAVQYGRRLLAISQGDGCEYAWIAYGLSWALLRWQRTNEMTSMLRVAERSFMAHGDATGVLHCRRVRLAGEWLVGVGAELQPQFAALAHDYESEGQVVEAARARLLQALHLHTMGQAATALEACQALAPIIEAWGTPVDQARLAWIRGMALTNIQEPERAAQALDLALNVFRRKRMLADVGRCLFDRSWLAQRCEIYDRALHDLEAAHDIAKRLDLPYLIAACQKNRGLALSRVGRYGEAIMSVLQARDGYVALGRQDFIVGCELNLGIISYYTGLYDLAMAAFQKAERSYRDMSRIWMMYACQRNQALVLRAQGDQSAALRVLQSLEEPISQSGDKLEQAEYWQSLAHVQSDLQHFGQASYFFAQAQRQFQQLGNLPAVAECLLELAWLDIVQLASAAGDEQSDQRRLTRAEAALQRAAADLRDRPFHYWRVLYAQGQCAALQNRNISALNLYIQASGIVAVLRQEILNAHASSAIFRQAQRLYADAMRLALRQHHSLALLRLIEQQRSLNLYHHLQRNRYVAQGMVGRLPGDLQEQVQGLLQDGGSSETVRAAVQAFTEAMLHARNVVPRIDKTIAAPGDVDSVRALLAKMYPNGWLAISYAFCDNQLLVMTLDLHSIECSTIALDGSFRAMLDEACLPEYRLYTYADLAHIDRPESAPWAGLSGLATRLLPPDVQEKLHPNLRLLISPAGPLHALPWAALRLGETWLCERATIQLLPGIDYVQLMPEPPAQAGRGLLIGCSAFNGRGEDLSHVGEELDHIAQAYPDCMMDRREDADATSECLTGLSQTGLSIHHRFIHIASHAQLIASQGLLAHIQFWDRALMFDEIASLKLNATLVVLSMCDGSLSEILPGEEVLSLSHGFLAAGVRAVIASLWPLEDELSPTIMRLLYAGLAQGLDAAAALTDLQRACAASQGRLSLPIAWAGLQLIGIDQLSP